MSNDKRLVNLRMTDEEIAILADYCKRTGRTRTDVLRELVRGLAQQPSRPSRRAPTPRAKPKPKAAPAAVTRHAARLG